MENGDMISGLVDQRTGIYFNDEAQVFEALLFNEGIVKLLGQCAAGVPEVMREYWWKEVWGEVVSGNGAT